MKKEIRKIMKNPRNNYCVNIPKVMVRRLKWRENQKVVVVQDGETIIIRDWKK